MTVVVAVFLVKVFRCRAEFHINVARLVGYIRLHIDAGKRETAVICQLSDGVGKSCQIRLQTMKCRA